MYNSVTGTSRKSPVYRKLKRKLPAVSSEWSNERQFKDDPCEITGRKIASDLRQMTNFQRMIADKIINEVCFYGKAELLQIEDSFKLPHMQRFQSFHASPSARDESVSDQTDTKNFYIEN